MINQLAGMFSEYSEGEITVALIVANKKVGGAFVFFIYVSFIALSPQI
jgi:hypothetical protein